jgi:hypothetical protein
MRNDDKYDHFTKGLRKQTVGRILGEALFTSEVYDNA